MKKILLVLIVALMFLGCTENQRAKEFGGNMIITLDEDVKLVEATWKGDELWYLTRSRKDDEVSETYTFKEHSSFGIMEGTVTFIEQ